MNISKHNNIQRHITKNDAICMPVGTSVRCNNNLIIDEPPGIKLQNRYPNLAYELGKQIHLLGHEVWAINTGTFFHDKKPFWIMSFPVKTTTDAYDQHLTEKSFRQASRLADNLHLQHLYLLNIPWLIQIQDNLPWDIQKDERFILLPKS